MSNQLLETIAEHAPDMLERLSEGEILENLINILTTTEQQRLISIVISDWKDEPNYDLI